jgi:carbamoyltransferase
MIILGISYLSDAGACVVKDGKLISVINEERLNRVKLFYGIPQLSIKWVLKDSGYTMDQVDLIVTQGYCANEAGIEFIDHGLNQEFRIRSGEFSRVEERINNSKLLPEIKEKKLKEVRERYKHEDYVIFERNINIIRQLLKYKKPIKVIEHHISHAAGAYFMSGWKDCFVLTADGWGEMESNIFCKAHAGQLIKQYYSHSFDSLGYFYGSVTKALGFIPHRHEGKVLGLAACGNYRKPISWMKEMISYNKNKKRFEGGFENGVYTARFDNSDLETLVKKYSREDVASAVQKVLEDVVLDYVRDIVPKGSRLAVAGGIFANVRLNQKIMEMPQIKDFFVFPQMGDGGLALGSALYYYSTLKPLKPVEIGSLYRGPAFSNEEIEKEIKGFGYTFKFYKDIEKKIAELLVDNKVIMRFAGRMEYGPRALGNRSILFSTKDKSVNDWLNHALRRSEFMPFAPSTLKERAGQCYKNITKHWKRGLYMTTTFACTPWMKKVSPGVVHVDGTARPQLVTREMNPSYHKILKQYYALTKIPSLINTSFNMHEEPIVCTPHDALRAFQDSNLKYLVIENYLITNDQEDILFANP